MKKNLVIGGLTAMMAMSLLLTGCGSQKAASADVEVYTAQTAYIEEAYRGDCWNGVSESLTLNGDGTYVLTENTSVIQAGGTVVTYWTYTMKGTYTEGEEADGVKSVTLAAPTEVVNVMNDAVTTSADDASLLEYRGEMTLDLNTATMKYPIAAN